MVQSYRYAQNRFVADLFYNNLYTMHNKQIEAVEFEHYSHAFVTGVDEAPEIHGTGRRPAVT